MGSHRPLLRDSSSRALSRSPQCVGSLTLSAGGSLGSRTSKLQTSNLKLWFLVSVFGLFSVVQCAAFVCENWNQFLTEIFVSRGWVGGKKSHYPEFDPPSQNPLRAWDAKVSCAMRKRTDSPITKRRKKKNLLMRAYACCHVTLCLHLFVL